MNKYGHKIIQNSANMEVSKILKELDSPIPKTIKILLSGHSVMRMDERLFRTPGLTEKEMLEKLSSIKRGVISEESRNDTYLLGFDGSQFAFVLKRLNRSSFIAKTFEIRPGFLVPQNVKRTEVSVSF